VGSGAAAAGAGAAGASWTGAAVRAGLGAAGFFAAAGAGVGRGEGNGALASDGDEDGGDDNADAGGRGVEGVVACPGSGVMMLIGGVEAALGNSALVGLPSGIDGGSAATGPGVTAGMFHEGA
jgi:hypothetical protein